MTIIGDKSTCTECGTAIIHNGTEWTHVRDDLWKHRAIPAHSLESLERKLAAQKQQITHMQGVLRDKNILLDRLHNLWCTGPCNGFHRWTDTPLTEAEVQWAERYARNLRFKFEYLKKNGSPKVVGAKDDS